MKKLLLATLLVSGQASASASIELDVCGEATRFDSVPKRAVANDINMLKIMLALDLKQNMAGYSGVSGYHKMSEQVASQVAALPELAPKYPSMENLLNVDADFYFAGWNYGMKVGGEVTPATLAKYDIAAYAIRESCAHVQKRDTVSLADTFYDIEAIGKIFAVQSKADVLITGYKSRLSQVSDKLDQVKSKSVFVYDSGEDKPFTSGGLAVPNAIIEAAGGSNVMKDVKKSWTQVNWEAVVEANPEHIVIIDYGTPSAAEKIAFLKQLPATAEVTAVKNNQFTILSYAAATPGIENIDAVEKLAMDLYPERFSLK